MKTRKKVLSVTIVLLIVLVAVIAFSISIPIQASEIQQVKPTGEISTQVEIEYGTGTSLRVMELNRVLGIPIEELNKLTPDELRKLFIENADKLGVNVYTATIDKDGNQVIEKVAGEKVFKAPDFEKGEEEILPTPTPEPYPASERPRIRKARRYFLAKYHI